MLRPPLAQNLFVSGNLASIDVCWINTIAIICVACAGGSCNKCTSGLFNVAVLQKSSPSSDFGKWLRSDLDQNLNLTYLKPVTGYILWVMMQKTTHFLVVKSCLQAAPTGE